MSNNNFSFFSTEQSGKRFESEKSYLIPSLYIPDEKTDESLNEWRFSLNGRLDFVKMKFVVAEDAFRKQWKLSGNYQLFPLGKGFFIIKLANELEMKYIWNGFWKVDSQILKLRLWEPNFNPAAQKSTTAFVWVNFPGLGIEYWKENILMSLGDDIGRAIKEVQIPKLPSFCNHCKVVGHLVSECRVLRNESVQYPLEEEIPKVVPKKVWKLKEKNQQQPVVEKVIEKTFESAGRSSGKFHVLQELVSEEPLPISVEKLLEVASCSSSVINYVTIEIDKVQGDQEVVKKIIKPKNIILITTSKQNVVNLVKEKKGVRSPATSQSEISK
ncbi:uncharacterized protein LOC113305989 [Papaver somniferum]|uniref:uncharacterized protein LOC113305989 n=1 Tax=Papaver somniferum TaxID=3469 RepID=UPI000E704E20|nr:uncharacterized protein LOC113305989 [Papaver somniferum]